MTYESEIIYWLFGRSEAGKTTIARRFQHYLKTSGRHSLLLDGDMVRGGVCADLSYDEEARTENHRRIAEIARLVAGQSIPVVAATIAPLRRQGEIVNEILVIPKVVISGRG